MIASGKRERERVKKTKMKETTLNLCAYTVVYHDLVPCMPRPERETHTPRERERERERENASVLLGRNADKVIP